MYLYQAFNLRMRLISIFQRLSRIYRALICMESLELTYKLIALKIKSKTLDQIYFMSQVFQEDSYCYDKKKK